MKKCRRHYSVRFSRVVAMAREAALEVKARTRPEPVNLGNPNEFTIKELAEEVSRICDVPLKVKICPLPQDDPRQRQPDITRAQNLLGWKPTVPLRDGLNRTVDYFKRTLLNEPSGLATAAPL